MHCIDLSSMDQCAAKVELMIILPENICKNWDAKTIIFSKKLLNNSFFNSMYDLTPAAFNILTISSFPFCK